MDTNQIDFLPAIPVPLVFDVQGRIQELRGYLDPNHPLCQPEQKDNIKAVIRLYEENKIDGIKETWIMEGKVVTEEEADNRPGRVWVWCEGMRYQYAQKYTYGHGPFGPHFHEVRIQLFAMLLRLIPHRGGDGTVHGIIAMNDTGSDILSLFRSDTQRLGNIQGYAGWQGVVGILCANGTVNHYPKIEVEVQLVRDNNMPWSDWIREVAKGALLWRESNGRMRYENCACEAEE